MFQLSVVENAKLQRKIRSECLKHIKHFTRKDFSDLGMKEHEYLRIWWFLQRKSDWEKYNPKWNPRFSEKTILKLLPVLAFYNEK